MLVCLFVFCSFLAVLSVRLASYTIFDYRSTVLRRPRLRVHRKKPPCKLCNTISSPPPTDYLLWLKFNIIYETIEIKVSANWHSIGKVENGGGNMDEENYHKKRREMEIGQYSPMDTLP